METMRTDVLVLGGGTAGVTAAIAAAEEGAGVILVERDNALGGVGVRAGIHNYYYGTQGGLQHELDKSALDVSKQWGCRAIGFHPEAKGAVIAQRLARLGVNVLYEAVVAEMVMDGNRVTGAVVETAQSAVAIYAKATIDATGDGDAAFLAGAPFTLGRAWDGCQHAYSLIPRFVDAGNVLKYRNYDVGWIDVTDPADVSRAYRVGRKYVWRAGETPANMHYTVVGPQLGVREGRRIIGDYVLHQDDLLLDRRFDDVVMRCYAHHENHAYDYANESELSQIWIGVLGQWKFLFGGDVPYRCLLPAGIEGLLIGCRALSQDHDCGNLLRMQRDMQKLGEVAGTAAALSVRAGVAPRVLDVRTLQRRLIARGVLRESDLSRESEPWLAFAGEERRERRRVLDEGVRDDDVRALIGRLGTEEEPAALWWLWQFGEASVPPLLEALRAAAGARRTGIAFALGLLKRPECVPDLAETFRSRDPGKPNDLDRTMARWQSALVLLGRMADPAVCDDALELLGRERTSTTLLLLLHYAIAVAGKMTDAQKARTRARMQAILADPGLGGDYTLHNSGVSIPAEEETRSIKWSLDLNAAYLLELVGADGRSTLERYADDARGYARAASATLRARLDQGKERNGHGAIAARD